MARINIEDSIWTDRRFKALERNIGELKAIGAWVVAAKTAQEYWKRGELIPIDVWRHLEFKDELVDCGLLRLDEADGHAPGYYLTGSEHHFAWLKSKIENGRKGGEARAAKRSAKNPVATASECVANPSESKRPLSDGYPPTPTPTLPPALTLTTELRTKGGAAPPPADVEFPKNNSGNFIAAYVKAFQARYGPNHRPDLRGKVQGQIKNLLKDYPEARAIELIQAYCQMDGQRGWFKTKGHDFGTFIENLNPVSIALEEGEEAGNRKINWDEFFEENGKGGSA